MLGLAAGAPLFVACFVGPSFCLPACLFFSFLSLSMISNITSTPGQWIQESTYCAYKFYSDHRIALLAFSLLAPLSQSQGALQHKGLTPRLCCRAKQLSRKRRRWLSPPPRRAAEWPVAHRRRSICTLSIQSSLLDQARRNAIRQPRVSEQGYRP